MGTGCVLCQRGTKFLNVISDSFVLQIVEIR